MTRAFTRRQADSLRHIEYAEAVLRLGDRLTVVVLVAALIVGNLSVCAAWQPSPDSHRMDCHQPPSCPMHSSAAADQHANGAVPQDPANACCRASEPGRTDPATPLFSSASSISLDHTQLPDVALMFDARFAPRKVTERPPSHGVRRYLLLSVLLV